MKRLAAALFVTAAFSTSVWAASPVEREMNDFNGVSQPKSARAPQPEENAPAQHGYNKAIEEHKQHMEAHEARHGKHGRKPHAKKHHHTSDTPAAK